MASTVRESESTVTDGRRLLRVPAVRLPRTSVTSEVFSEACRLADGYSGEREHGNYSVTCVRTGSGSPSRVGPGRMCDEPW